MNFELNEQQLSIQKMAREFTEKKVAPKVLERDETRVYDVELYQELSRMGFLRPDRAHRWFRRQRHAHLCRAQGG